MTKRWPSCTAATRRSRSKSSTVFWRTATRPNCRLCCARWRGRSVLTLDLPQPMNSRIADTRISARRCHQLPIRSEEHTSELQSQSNLVCRLLLEKKKKKTVKSIQINVHNNRIEHT